MLSSMERHLLSAPRRIVLTGASRGIGREAAVQLARLGHRVVLVARHAAPLAEVAAEIAALGGQAEAVPLDITDAAAVERVAREILARGPCDVLVNNAGYGDQQEFRPQHPATQRAEMELNYWGALHSGA